MSEYTDRDKNPELDAARERVKAAGRSPLEFFAARMQRQHDELVQKYGSDFDKPAGHFGMNIAEATVIAEWVASLRAEILAIQNAGSKLSGIDDSITGGEPYYGATGGGLSYTFIPTSLGTIITVKETITGKELNVSDALGWYFYG
jgi:hypothetical protein